MYARYWKKKWAHFIFKKWQKQPKNLILFMSLKTNWLLGTVILWEYEDHMICHIRHQMSYFGFLSYFCHILLSEFFSKKWEIQSIFKLFLQNIWLDLTKMEAFGLTLCETFEIMDSAHKKYRWNSCFHNRDWLLCLIRNFFEFFEFFQCHISPFWRHISRF